MIPYIDASVVLRVVLKSPDPLREWPQLEEGISSALLRVECYRALERLWHDGHLSADTVASKRGEVETTLGRLRVLPINNDVLELAAQPLPTHLKTLDAIHLASAILYRRSEAGAQRHVLFATHDELLAKAARELHFDVIGT